MNKSKIDWCDMTWNPVTGCLHGCDYCYAEKIANRFGGHYERNIGNLGCSGNTQLPQCGHAELTDIYSLDVPMIKANCDKAPYPYGFAPTFHKYRLDEPKRKTKGQKIFVCSMADLFGEWVPDEWIEKVFEACKKAYHHRYLFLTKNPKKYSKVYRNSNDYRCYMWFGTTVTDNDSFMEKGFDLFSATGADSKGKANRFLSIEPLLGEIKSLSLFENLKFIDWIIIGAQTGPGAIPPKTEWVQRIIDQARFDNIPVFLKDNLNWPDKIQEYPEGLK